MRELNPRCRRAADRDVCGYLLPRGTSPTSVRPAFPIRPRPPYPARLHISCGRSSVESGMESSPMLCAISVTLNMLRPRNATLRPYSCASSSICCKRWMELLKHEITSRRSTARTILPVSALLLARSPYSQAGRRSSNPTSTAAPRACHIRRKYVNRKARCR